MATRPLGSSPRPQVRFNCQTRASRQNSTAVRNHRQEGRVDHQEPLSNSRVWRCSPWLGYIQGDVWSARIAIGSEG